MVESRGMGFPNDAEDADNRRRAGRLTCSMLGSSLGDVLDLSVTGMRCRSSKSLPLSAGQHLDFDLRTLAGTLRMQGKVVWSTKKGLRRFEAGVQFVNVDEKLRRTLVEVARISTDRQYMRKPA